MRPNFHDVAGLWDCDGSLRDIYVQNTEAVHWDRFDRLLSQYEFTYTFDGMPLPFPGSRGALANREGSHLLSIPLDGTVINCHFFIAQQLELDISAKDVAGPLEHERILAFVENLAEALELPADITPENWEESPFLTYSPATKSWLMHEDPP
ncbi:hypothetical protein [Massilia sp. DWR3-1-1]|uniref:hypothetical protein n=1 Tax=Massilia sp. DWR3-1-1 TaxID=2804559 RepID=UPI003CFAD50B